MTHEQKPKSAEFRAREAQIADLAFEISEWNSYNDNQDITIAREHILEAEARGAAEQRQKDAEGAEPGGYVLAGLKELFSNPADPLSAAMILASKEAPHIVPLYLRPANVAALEARVKELEGTLRNVRASIEQAGPKVLVDTLWMPGQPETVVDYISAAIREGGEHG